MSSKLLYITYILTILTFTSTSCNNDVDAEIRGFLLFEKDSDRPILINPNYAVYYRKLSLNQLREAVKLTHIFTHTYKDYCHFLNKSITDIKTTYTEQTYKTFRLSTHPTDADGDPEGTCKNNGGILAEPKTLIEYDEMMRLIKPTSTVRLPVGIHYNEKLQQVVYKSNNEPVLLWEYVWLINPNEPEFFLRYSIKSIEAITALKKGKFFIEPIGIPHEPYALRQTRGDNHFQSIVCEYKQYTTPSNDYFMKKLALFMCNRDYNNIKGMTDIVTKELNHFESPNNVESIQADEFISPCHITFNKTLIESLAYKILNITENTKGLTPSSNINLQFGIYLLTENNNLTFKDFLLTKREPLIVTDSLEKLRYQLQCKLKLPKYNNEDILDKDLQKLENNKDVLISKLINLKQDLMEIMTQRQKRDIMNGLDIVTDILSSSARNDHSTISRISQTLQSNNEKAVKTILHNAINIENININQKQIAENYDALKHEIMKLRNRSNDMAEHLPIVLAEMDNKRLCTNLQNLIRTSLLIIASAVNAAENGKASPYVFSQTQLNTISTNSRNKNIQLSNKLNEVKTKYYRSQDEFIFIFSIPITDNSNMYRIFSIRNFPIFEQTQTIITIPDTSHIAISIDNTKYIYLTDKEYRICNKNSFCYASNSVNQIDSEDSCVALSYKTKNNHCPIENSSIESPFFVTYRNITFYSTPKNTEGNLICPNYNIDIHSETITGHITFSNMGSIAIKESCFIELKKGRRIYPHYATNMKTDLGISTFTEAFKFLTNTQTIGHNISRHHKYNEIPTITLRRLKPMETTEILQMTFTAEQLIPVIVIIMLISSIIIAILGIIYASSETARKWFKASCFCSNPRKWWDFKGYILPTFEKLDKNDPLGSIIRTPRQIDTEMRQRLKNYPTERENTTYQSNNIQIDTCGNFPLRNQCYDDHMPKLNTDPIN